MKTDPIQTIKTQLKIQEVIAYYGHKPTRKGAMPCPFHEEKKGKKSMQLYEDTNRYHCFKDGCVGNGDVLDFIKQSEGVELKPAMEIARTILDPSYTAKVITETTANKLAVGRPTDVPTDTAIAAQVGSAKQGEESEEVSTLSDLVKEKQGFSYSTREIKLECLGGIDLKHLDRLKVTLKISIINRKFEHYLNDPQLANLPYRNNIDLYNDTQLEKALREAASKLEIGLIELTKAVGELTELLETYRLDQLDTQEKKEAPKRVLTAEEQAEILPYLKQSKLLETINFWLGQSGIVGEEKNRLMLFAVSLSRKMKSTLHVLLQGTSGSGKTHLLKGVVNLHHAESRHLFTRITEYSFYNWPENFLCHKILAFEDMDGLGEEALLALREMMSNDKLVSGTSIKDNSGSDFNSGVKTVNGPVCTIGATTKGDIYEDNESRIFTLAVDESEEQTQKIIAYQNKKAAGLINEEEEQGAKRKLELITEILEPKAIINPYAGKLQLPQKVQKKRRLNALLNRFIEVITNLHQYQRVENEQGKVISTKQDVQQAIDLMFDTIVLKADELDGSLRQFYEQLKNYLESKEQAFRLIEIRQNLNVSKTQLHRYVEILLELEYIHRKGHANKGYTYQINYWDDYQKLRVAIKEDLQEQLEKL